MFGRLINILNSYNKKNINYLVDDIKLLKINESEWYKYINLKKYEYNKSVIYRNDRYEIMLISWGQYSSTKIHNHPSNGCIMKILKGSLIEETYDSITLNKIGTNNYKKNNTSYIHDDLYKHKIINNSSQSFSLHIYSPPNFYK